MMFLLNCIFLAWFGSLTSWSILSEQDYMKRYFFIVEDLFAFIIIVLIPTNLGSAVTSFHGSKMNIDSFNEV